MWFQYQCSEIYDIRWSYKDEVKQRIIILLQDFISRAYQQLSVTQFKIVLAPTGALYSTLLYPAATFLRFSLQCDNTCSKSLWHDQGNSGKLKENFWHTLDTLRGHSENTQRIPREHAENTQRKFRKHLENTFLRPANAFLFSADSRISVTQSANISRWSLLIAVRIIYRGILTFS